MIYQLYHSICQILIDLLLGLLLADLIVGVFHWIKDSYFTPHTPIIGDLFIRPSRLHHIKPNFMTGFSDWDILYSSTIWTMLWALPLASYMDLNFIFPSLVIFICLNDLVHKYEHLDKDLSPKWIKIMRKLNLFQKSSEHDVHHTYPHDSAYCPITPFWNQILDRVGFWRGLEHIIFKVSGEVARSKGNEFKQNSKYPGGIKFVQ